MMQDLTTSAVIPPDKQTDLTWHFAIRSTFFIGGSVLEQNKSVSRIYTGQRFFACVCVCYFPAFPFPSFPVYPLRINGKQLSSELLLVTSAVKARGSPKPYKISLPIRTKAKQNKTDTKREAESKLEGYDCFLIRIEI